MSALAQLEKLYESYLQESNRNRSDKGLRTVLSGLFMGQQDEYKWVDRFIADFKAVIDDFDGDGEDARAIIEFILKKGVEYQKNVSVGMLFTAVQQFLPPLLELQTPEYRAQLAKSYDAMFPKYVRTPVMWQFRKLLS